MGVGGCELQRKVRQYRSVAAHQCAVTTALHKLSHKPVHAALPVRYSVTGKVGHVGCCIKAKANFSFSLSRMSISPL